VTKYNSYQVDSISFADNWRCNKKQQTSARTIRHCRNRRAVVSIAWSIE